MLPTCLAQYQPQGLFRNCGSVCLVISVHFSHLKPCTCLATAGSFHKDFNSSVMYKEPFCFLRVELTI